jgi:hypothetical protein
MRELGIKKMMEKTLDKPLIRKAIKHLKSSDKVICEVIKKHGPCTMTPALDNPFLFMCKQNPKKFSFLG